jgi:hypothetical protein
VDAELLDVLVINTALRLFGSAAESIRVQSVTEESDHTAVQVAVRLRSDVQYVNVRCSPVSE